MAEETNVNGQDDDRTVEIAGDEDRSNNFAKTSVLMQKIEALEQDKRQLAYENEIMKERIKKLKEEMVGLEADKAKLNEQIEKSKTDKKALEAIAARAAELEADVSRLQHDLITSMTEGQDANEELLELRKALEELRVNDSDKVFRLEAMEKERNLLLEMVEKGSESERVKIEDLKSRIRDLEREYRERVDEKDGEIRVLKKMAGDLKSVVDSNKVEMEKSNKEKEEFKTVKNELEALLKKSEGKVKEMESEVGLLQKELDASEKVISGFKEKEEDKSVGSVNGKAVIVDRGVDGDGEKGTMGLKLEWPVVAASTGALAAVAVVFYLRYGQKR